MRKKAEDTRGGDLNYRSGLDRLKSGARLLALVKTPLQLLNVLELADWTATPPERRALLISPLTLPNKSAQVMRGVNGSDWAFVLDGNHLLAEEAKALHLLRRLPVPLQKALEPIARTWALRRTANRFGKHLPSGWQDDDLVLVHAKPVDHFPQALRQVLQVPQVYVDDGIGAIEFSRTRLRNAFSLPHRLFVEAPAYRKRWGRPLLWLLSRQMREVVHWALFRPNPDTSVSSDHFTAFNIVSRAPEQVVRNSYARLRGSFPPIRRRAGFGVFLGQPHVQQGRVSFAHYVAGIRFAMQQAPAALHWRYLLHPEESRETGAEIQAACGTEPVRGNVCVEFDLPSGSELPTVIAGYNSSALSTLALLMGDAAKYYALRWPAEAVGPHWVGEMQTFYDELVAAGQGRIRILDMDFATLESLSS